MSNGQIQKAHHPSFFTPNPTPFVLHSAMHPSIFCLNIEVRVWHRRNSSCFFMFCIIFWIQFHFCEKLGFLNIPPELLGNLQSSDKIENGLWNSICFISFQTLFFISIICSWHIKPACHSFHWSHFKFLLIFNRKFIAESIRWHWTKILSINFFSLTNTDKKRWS